MNEQTEIETRLLAVLRPLVEGFTRFHKDLKFNVISLGHSSTVAMSAHSDDVPRLIGSQGIMHHSLEVIAAALMRRVSPGRRTRLVVEEPKVGRRNGPAPYVSRPEWDATEFQKLVVRLCAALFNGTPSVGWHHGDDGWSVIEVVTEEETPSRELSDAVARVIEAIGRNQGHKVYADVILLDAKHEPQRI
jgi:predicted RNA-binding protein YlqC (UPF0109 family)